jgi:hypothetical protein
VFLSLWLSFYWTLQWAIFWSQHFLALFAFVLHHHCCPQQFPHHCCLQWFHHRLPPELFYSLQLSSWEVPQFWVIRLSFDPEDAKHGMQLLMETL